MRLTNKMLKAMQTALLELLSRPTNEAEVVANAEKSCAWIASEMKRRKNPPETRQIRACGPFSE